MILQGGLCGVCPVQRRYLRRPIRWIEVLFEPRLWWFGEPAAEVQAALNSWNSVAAGRSQESLR